ncbi:hypothetical protein JW930_06395 [Candidatus Woesearchaeota archaeon]|nr:hypothetical protein [Candidatus Woesearchaeota archaeon]
MNERELKQKISEGDIHFRTIIEVLGKPAEHIEKTLQNYLKKIEEDKEIKLIRKEVAKPKPHEDLFTIFAELELLTKNASALVSFCFDYMPSSIEILAPEQLIYESNDLSDFLNDMQARLHAVNIGAQEIKQKNIYLIQNTSILLRNFIFYILEKPITIAEIGKITGVPEKDVSKVLGILIKEGKIVQDKDKYVKK